MLFYYPVVVSLKNKGESAMCEFISWKKTLSGTILFLTDKEVSSPFGRETLKGTRNNDILGHGAITTYYGKEATMGAVSFEEEEFWDKSKYPPEIAQYLESPETLLATWGEMLKKVLEPEKAYQILKGAPEPWRKGLSNLLIQIVSKNAGYSFRILLNNKSLTQEERALSIEGVLKDANCSYCALRDIETLTQEERALLIEGVSKDAFYSYSALLYNKSLTQEEKAILKKAQSK